MEFSLFKIEESEDLGLYILFYIEEEYLFVLFINYPEAVAYILKIFLKWISSLLSTFPDNIVSSTNCWWVTSSTTLVILIPLIRLSCWYLKMDLPSDSTRIIKRNLGDIGSPYWIPLDYSKKAWGEPLTKTENNGVEIQ